MTRRVLVDTGPLVAMLSTADQHHSRCVAAGDTLPSPLSTSWSVITEAAYLLASRGGDQRDILALVKAQLQIESLEKSDLIAIDKILAKYADQGFSLADASLMHLADREAIREVFTIDAKDFSLFRTAAGEALDIIG